MRKLKIGVNKYLTLFTAIWNPWKHGDFGKVKLECQCILVFLLLEMDYSIATRLDY
jgi:hypothetical protein